MRPGSRHLLGISSTPPNLAAAAAAVAPSAVPTPHLPPLTRSFTGRPLAQPYLPAQQSIVVTPAPSSRSNAVLNSAPRRLRKRVTQPLEALSAALVPRDSCPHSGEKATCPLCREATVSDLIRGLTHFASRDALTRVSRKDSRPRCRHDRVRYYCAACNGKGICAHKRVRSSCTECAALARSLATAICAHNRRRTRCRECNGGSLCRHGRIRTTCVPCRGGGICQHEKRRGICKVCRGSEICCHGHRRAICHLCKGSALCEHGNRRTRCNTCLFPPPPPPSKRTAKCKRQKKRHP